MAIGVAIGYLYLSLTLNHQKRSVDLVLSTAVVYNLY